VALIVAGTIEMDPTKIVDFWPHAEEMMRATHQEEGCIEYSFTLDRLTPGRVRVYEKWESEEALAAHFEVSHMATFRAALADLSVTGRSISKYTVADETPL